MELGFSLVGVSFGVGVGSVFVFALPLCEFCFLDFVVSLFLGGCGFRFYFWFSDFSFVCVDSNKCQWHCCICSKKENERT